MISKCLYCMFFLLAFFCVDAQVTRPGTLLHLKDALKASKLGAVDTSFYTVINLPRLDNCDLMLQTLLQEKQKDSGYRGFEDTRSPENPEEPSTQENDAREHEQIKATDKNQQDPKNEPMWHDHGYSEQEPIDLKPINEEHTTTGVNEFPSELINEEEDMDMPASSMFGNYSIHSGSFAFGRGIPVDINVLTRGTWFNLKNGMGRILKLGIKSPTAYSLNLLFDRFWLPNGAELYIHGQTAMLGAYTAAVNNKKHMKFATTPLPGSFLLIEYYAPDYVKEDPILHICSVVHGFRPIMDILNEESENSRDQISCVRDTAAALELESESENESIREDALRYFNGIRSGNCNINAPACSEAKRYIDQSRSVAIVMTANGQKFCTGALINNLRQDGRQLFLTADHCVNEFNSDFRYNILGFNYQSKTCPNNYIEWPLTKTVQGLKLLARSRDSDFALFEVQEKIPTSFNVYLAGWSASQESPSSVATIHHPSGDVKKISLVIPDPSSDIKIYLDCWNECPQKYHWKVSRWSKGVTEPGSSGAPLFNEHGLIIGQLHGGASSCKNPTGFDIFGSLHASMFSRFSYTNSLRAWLDPERLGHLSIEGAYLKDLRRRSAK